jgi:hypothetical protein
MTRRQFDFMHKTCVGALHDARQALGTRQRGGQTGERGEGGEGGEGGGWKPAKASASSKGGKALTQKGAGTGAAAEAEGGGGGGGGSGSGSDSGSMSRPSRSGLGPLLLPCCPVCGAPWPAALRRARGT